MKATLPIKYIFCLFLTIVFSLVYFFLYDMPKTGIDDADIYFVYIRNFVEGHGFVYNVGGERVEGFTSFLWVLLLSPIYMIAGNFEKAVLILNIVIMSFTIFRAVQFLDTIVETKKFISSQSLFLLIYIFFIPGYIDWTVLTLMESSFWCFLLTMAVIDLGYYILHKKKSKFILINIYVFLLVFTRPESLLWGLFFAFMFGFIQYFNTKNIKFSIKYALGIVGVFCLALVILISFRLSYFGYPLPNTYYAKVSSDTVSNVLNGLYYLLFSTWQSPFLWVFLISSIASLLLILVPLFNFVRGNNKDFTQTQILQLLLAATSLLSILIPIYVGGDHFELLRFFQPFVLVYLFCMLNTGFWKTYFTEVRVRVKGIPYLSYIVILALFPFIYFSTKTPLHFIRKERSPIFGQFKIAAVSREEGQKLNKFFDKFDEKPSIGVSAAGGFAYTYYGPTVDLMGLNDTRMAHAQKKKVGIKNHAAFDIPTFFEIAPDVFHGYTHGSKVLSIFHDSLVISPLDVDHPDFNDSFVNELYKGVFATKEFNATYAPVIIHNPEMVDFYYQTFVHKNFLPKLKSHGYEVIMMRESANLVLTAPNAQQENLEVKQ